MSWQLEALASALLSLVLWRLLPKRFNTPFKWSYAYLFLLCFFVPVGGALVCLGSLVFSRMFPRQRDLAGVGLVALPEFTSMATSASVGLMTI